MNILSSEQMRQIEEQLLNANLSPLFQLKLPKGAKSQPIDASQISILPTASESTQFQIRKIVSLADNMSSLPLGDANTPLKMFTIAIFSMLYQGRYRGNEGFDSALLQALKCSLYSPDVNLMVIKGLPASFNSSQMKASAATFFAFMAQQQENFAAQSFTTAKIILQENEQLFNCFILFFRCILLALQVQGAGNWKGQMNEKTSLQSLLDYFDLSYRSIGQLFLLYEQGLFLSVTQKQLVYGQYFENEGEKQSEKKQMEIKSSIKMNMIESFLVNVNSEDRPSKKKNGVVDSDLKMFNFMLESSQEVEEEKSSNMHDMETPHFKDNEQFHFGKKKKDEQSAPTYRPEEVRFQFQKLIKDESMEEIEPEDLINFNAQFQDAPTPVLGGQFNFLKYEQKESDSPSSLNERSTSNKIMVEHNNLNSNPRNRMSLADHRDTYNYNTSSSTKPQNRLKKAATEICSNDSHILSSNHQKYPINLYSCFCREMRMNRNSCVSKVVQFSFTPFSNIRRQYNTNFSPKNINFKASPRTITEGKSQTLNKEFIAKQKKSQIAEERTPSFLKNIKKQNSNNLLKVEKDNQEAFPLSAHQIGKREKTNTTVTDQVTKRQTSIIQSQHQIIQGRQKFRDDDGLMKMKFSDNQQVSSKKYDLYNRGMLGQSNSNWQTTSNFHQRQLTSTSPLSQAKSTFIGQATAPQSKNISPLKFFAPVQIIAPTVYVNSNGNDTSSNIVFKLSELHETSPKLIRGPHHSPFTAKTQPGNSENINMTQNPLIK